MLREKKPFKNCWKIHKSMGGNKVQLLGEWKRPRDWLAGLTAHFVISNWSWFKEPPAIIQKRTEFYRKERDWEWNAEDRGVSIWGKNTVILFLSNNYSNHAVGGLTPDSYSLPCLAGSNGSLANLAKFYQFLSILIIGTVYSNTQLSSGYFKAQRKLFRLCLLWLRLNHQQRVVEVWRAFSKAEPHSSPLGSEDMNIHSPCSIDDCGFSGEPWQATHVPSKGRLAWFLYLVGSLHRWNTSKLSIH